jgi:hypothetical protein
MNYKMRNDMTAEAISDEFNIAGSSTLTNGSYSQNLVTEERRFLIYSSFHHHMNTFRPNC